MPSRSLSERGIRLESCPSWCIDHRVDDQDRQLHLGQVIEVERTQRAEGCPPIFELRLAAVDGGRPRLMLDGVAVGSEALLSELHRAESASELRASGQLVT